MVQTISSVTVSNGDIYVIYVSVSIFNCITAENYINIGHKESFF